MADESPKPDRRETRIDWGTEPLRDPGYYASLSNTPLREKLQHLAPQLPNVGHGVNRRAAVGLIRRTSGFDEMTAGSILRSTKLAGIIPDRKQTVENGKSIELYDGSDILATVLLAGSEDDAPFQTERSEMVKKGFFDMDATAEERLTSLGNHRLRGILHRRFIGNDEVSTQGEVIVPNAVRSLAYVQTAGELNNARRRAAVGKSSKPPERVVESLPLANRLSPEQVAALDRMNEDHAQRNVGNPQFPEELLPLLERWNSDALSKLFTDIQTKPDGEEISLSEGPMDYPSYLAMQYVRIADSDLPLEHFPLAKRETVKAGTLRGFVRYTQNKLNDVSSLRPEGDVPTLGSLYQGVTQSRE